MFDEQMNMFEHVFRSVSKHDGEVSWHENIMFVIEHNVNYFFEAPLTFDEKTTRKKWKEDANSLMSEFNGVLNNLDTFNSEDVAFTGWYF